MPLITFRRHVIGRGDNPFLILDSDIDVRGADYDTLRAGAAQAIMDDGWVRGRWVAFEIEGHQFKAKPHYNDIWVRTR
jgi:hypothetical protein